MHIDFVNILLYGVAVILNELNVLQWLVVSNPDDRSVIVSILVDVPVLWVDVS